MKFSIITITYNAAEALPRTVDSVFAQTWPCVEHIIVDGASTDATLDVARDYERRSREADSGHDVVITSESDNGLYDAMNKGLDRATGDYVLFLNAGDFFPDAEVLTVVAAKACGEQMSHGNRPAVVYGDTDIVDSEGRYLYPRRLRPPRRLA